MALMVAANPSRKESQPYRTQPVMNFAANLLEASHEEALYAYGEFCVFTMMWRPEDHDAGLVARCSTCFTGPKSRQAAAFDQPTEKRCPDCYGTTFEGGFRAQIVRPTLMADRNRETNDEIRGVVTTDTVNFETTADFTLHKGDYIFRSTNERFQVEEKDEPIARTGFGAPIALESFSGSSTAHLEEKTSVAFLIPPIDAEDLQDLLGFRGSTTITNLSALDEVKPTGYLVSGEDYVPGGTPPPDPDPDPDPDSDSDWVNGEPYRVATPSSTWTFVHNLDTRPDVLLFVDSSPGERVFTDVSYPDDNTVVVTWPSPESGYIYYG